MEKRQKRAIAAYVIVIVLILAFVGGYWFIKERYPMKHDAEIVTYAKKYDLDPYYVAAIIWTESKFRNSAVSDKGATGLMQIMPETGEWIAGKLKLKGYSSAALSAPETNIQMGCWYLSYLYEQFKNWDTVAAAYNAGHGNVSKWLGNSDYSKDGVTLDEIPYAETKNYVQMVNRSYEIYKLLYKLA